ncbi:MAG: hypothetical protein ACYTBJ_01435 [Planctomycetota bacterium]|jgi:hypothetical protein
MRANRKTSTVAVVLVCCVISIWLSTPEIQGREKTYEIHPQILTPEYRTDAGRVIDAYERLMERYMDLTEGNLLRLGTDLQLVVRRLDSIDSKLTGLSARMGRIENALGIQLPEPPDQEKTEAEQKQEQDTEESS